MEGLIKTVLVIESLCQSIGMEIVLKMQKLGHESFRSQFFMVRRALCIILLFKNGSTGLKSETERAIF